MDRELLVDAIASEISGFSSLRKMARHYRVNPGLISRVLNGGDSPTLRRAMGLPLASVTVQPCPSCGEAHLVGWCVKERGDPRPPRKQPYRQQFRRAGSFGDEADALAWDGMMQALDMTTSEYMKERLRQWQEDANGRVE